MVKMGDKFIIEIGEVFHGDVVPDATIYEDHELYRVKGFDGLVFDENGLNKLEKYNNNAEREAFEHGYSQGLEKSSKVEKEQVHQKDLHDVWEAAKKIYKMSFREIEKIFACSVNDVMDKYNAAEAIDKIKAYEEQKKAEEEIKVGDEVVCIQTREKGVIICVENESGRIHAIINGDDCPQVICAEEWKRTGKHYDIDGILKDMRMGNMGIYNRFREHFTEKQEKSRLETEILFSQILTGIGKRIQMARVILLLPLESGETYEKRKMEACEALEELEEELL